MHTVSPGPAWFSFCPSSSWLLCLPLCCFLLIIRPSEPHHHTCGGPVDCVTKIAAGFVLCPPKLNRVLGNMS